MPKLVVTSEGLAGRSMELKVEKTTVGRLEDNAFQLPEPSVSSHHCEIFIRDKEVVIKDLNSTNGTFINGEKVTEASLKPGQILRLGQVELKLENGPPPASSASTKRVLDQTKVLPQGVKLGELERGGKVQLETTVFRKKTNKVNLIFLAVGVVLAIIVIVLLVLVLNKVGG